MSESDSREREEDRQRVADELRRVRDAVRDRALLEPDPGSALPAPAPVRRPQKVPPVPEPAAPEAPPRPDNTALNALWRVLEAPRRSWRDVLRRFRGGGIDAPATLRRQQDFNARQVQFDNEVLAYVEARLDATHRHYDRILGLHGDHMGEIDERHLILQEELVAHVHDLVRRIDLVLGQAERGRFGLESALKDLRARVAALEERLRRG
ncbi:MAG: hypothetical protein DMF80_15275 [Acidobacteria bacterium]|nr:MAG: hypothetical protein DMF80_15275 [Acidobacteriota bacterium]